MIPYLLIPIGYIWLVTTCGLFPGLVMGIAHIAIIVLATHRKSKP